jgi:hypothetical protein
MRIIKEDLTGCINKTGAPAYRYYVIKTPINETGICLEFKTKEEAEDFFAEVKRIAEI